MVKKQTLLVDFFNSTKSVNYSLNDTKDESSQIKKSIKPPSKNAKLKASRKCNRTIVATIILSDDEDLNSTVITQTQAKRNNSLKINKPVIKKTIRKTNSRILQRNADFQENFSPMASTSTTCMPSILELTEKENLSDDNLQRSDHTCSENSLKLDRTNSQLDVLSNLDNKIELTEGSPNKLRKIDNDSLDRNLLSSQNLFSTSYESQNESNNDITSIGSTSAHLTGLELSENTLSNELINNNFNRNKESIRNMKNFDEKIHNLPDTCDLSSNKVFGTDIVDRNVNLNRTLKLFNEANQSTSTERTTASLNDTDKKMEGNGESPKKKMDNSSFLSDFNDIDTKQLSLSEYGLTEEAFINDMSANTKNQYENLMNSTEIPVTPKMEPQNIKIKQEQTNEEPKESNYLRIKSMQELMATSSASLSRNDLKQEQETHEEKFKGNLHLSIIDYETSQFSSISSSMMNDLNDEARVQTFNGPEILKFFAHIYNAIMASPNLKSLISDDDRQVLDQFLELPGICQYISLKLYCRQAKWYPIQKLFPAIRLNLNTTDTNMYLDKLKTLSFIDMEYKDENLENLLNILSINELKILCKKLKLTSAKNTKEMLIKKVLTRCRTQATLGRSKNSEEIVVDLIGEILGPSIKMNHDFWMVLFRLQFIYYFPDPSITTTYELYQRIIGCTEGLIVLPKYWLDGEFRVFSCPEEFSSYAEAMALYFEYIEAKERKNELPIDLANLAFAKMRDIVEFGSTPPNLPQKPRFLRRFDPLHVYSKVLSSACIDFTKETDLVRTWLNFLIKNCKGSLKRGAWYSRLCIVHQKSKCDLAEILFDSFHDPNVSESDRYDLCKRSEKLLNSKKVLQDIPEELYQYLKDILEDYGDFMEKANCPHVTIEARQLKTKERQYGKAMYLYNESCCTVEDVATMYYLSQGYPSALHCEGRLIVTIFTLIFWDLIYEFYVPGAFVSPVQYVPLDLYSKDFYANRKEKIDERLGNIEEVWTSAELYSIIDRNIMEYGNTKSLHVPAYVFDKSNVLESVSCMGSVILAKILRYLVVDFRERQSGMPDLFLWNFQSKKWLFAEVKSQNDVLSVKQRLWLRFLHSIDAPAQVCHVKSVSR